MVTKSRPCPQGCLNPPRQAAVADRSLVGARSRESPRPPGRRAPGQCGARRLGPAFESTSRGTPSAAGHHPTSHPVARPRSEEPDAGNPHVRNLWGAGWATARSTRRHEACPPVGSGPGARRQPCAGAVSCVAGRSGPPLSGRTVQRFRPAGAGTTLMPHYQDPYRFYSLLGVV
jgi:hypothetical protein